MEPGSLTLGVRTEAVWVYSGTDGVKSWVLHGETYWEAY